MLRGYNKNSNQEMPRYPPVPKCVEKKTEITYNKEQAPDFPTPLGPLQLSLPGPVCSITVLESLTKYFPCVG